MSFKVCGQGICMPKNNCLQHEKAFFKSKLIVTHKTIQFNEKDF